MFHRCVIAVIGVLAVGTSAAAGPITFGDYGPALDGVRMRQQDLRAIFFGGRGSPYPSGSCGDCLGGSRGARGQDRRSNPDYKAVFPFSSSNLFTRPAESRARPTTPAQAAPAPAAGVPDLIAGPVTPAIVIAFPEQPLPAGGVIGSPAVEAIATPEPTTFALLGGGLVGALLLRRKQELKAR